MTMSRGDVTHISVPISVTPSDGIHATIVLLKGSSP